MKYEIELGHHDSEAAHGNADCLLCELLNKLGYKKVTNLFDEVKKYYG